MISHASKLKFMKFWSCDICAIDTDDYNVMLCIVQNRQEKVNLLIEIESDYHMVNVPQETLNEHRHEFFIDERTTIHNNEIVSSDSNDDDSLNRI